MPGFDLNKTYSLQVSREQGVSGFIRHLGKAGKAFVGPALTIEERATATFKAVAPLTSAAGDVSLEAVSMPGHYLVLDKPLPWPYQTSNQISVLARPSPGDAAFDERATFRVQKGLRDPKMVSLKVTNPGREPFLKMVGAQLFTAIPDSQEYWDLVTWNHLPTSDAPGKVDDDAGRTKTLALLKLPLLSHSADPAPSTGETTIGVIVVDYTDAKATADAASCWNALNPSKATAWFDTESNRKFNHKFVVHPQIIQLPKKFEEYRNDTSAVADGVDALLDIPDDWDVVVICSANIETLRSLFTSSRRTCTFDETATTPGEVRPTVFIDQSVYGEPDNRGWAVVAHEILHALGLPDLYGGTPARSFGWSMMGDCRTAWHLLGWEKLVLGWLTQDDFVFVESGIVAVEIVQQNLPGKKGVVVRDDSGSGGAYFFEWSQATGKTEQIRDDVKNKNRPPLGLLCYHVSSVDRTPRVTIYPYKRGDRNAGYGGAPLAAYPVNPKVSYDCGRNQVVGVIIPPSGSGTATKMKIQVGKSPNFVQRSYKTVFTLLGNTPVTALRIDEYLVSADGRWSVRFESDGSLYAYKGDVSKPGRHKMVARFGPELDAMQEKFEVYLGVNQKGIISSNYGPGPEGNTSCLLDANTPDPAVTVNGPVFLALETGKDGKPALNLYRGVMPTDPYKKLVVKLAWTELCKLNELGSREFVESEDGKFTLILQADNYLTLLDERQGFVWHLEHTGVRVSIDDEGRVCMWSKSNERTWRYDGAFTKNVDPALSKEFSFRVGSTGSVEVVQGEGAAAIVLYKLRN
jgi:M6 family metalloprotease-like protein